MSKMKSSRWMKASFPPWSSTSFAVSWGANCEYYITVHFSINGARICEKENGLPQSATTHRTHRNSG